MTDLKPCPFCSAKPEIWSDSRRTWGLVQHEDWCLFPSFRKHEIPEGDFAAWNARAERTCRETEIDKFFRGCSECGYMWEYMYGIGRRVGPNYCPNCGAKVVGE